MASESIKSKDNLRVEKTSLALVAILVAILVYILVFHPF